jgi:outer membrane receptor for ferrienterochelin and colicins
MKSRLLICLMLLLILPVSVTAQNDERTVYERALNAYSIGRFGESLSYLKDIKRTYSIVYRVGMYRLTALCYLANDDEQNAKKAIQDMLKVNPYYIATAKDPAKFTAMVESLRKSSITLVTASSEAESLEESPVPVVIITADMIQNSGARNMRELLSLYVPGMTQVETLKQPGISYHGIYSSEQENVLVMINGHRLNNRSLNSKNFDYSISLNNIKQIEVLRGPASSLYGNVALTGVVNIITKNGGDIDDVELSAAAGNFGTQQYTALIGKRFNDFDVSCWGSVTNIKGERYNIPVTSPVNYTKSNTAYTQIGAYNNHPSYNFGLTLTYKNFRLQYERSYSHYTLSMTDNADNFISSDASLPYNLDKYPKFEGEGPGNGILNNYLDFSYNKDLNEHLSIGGSLYIDYDEMRVYSPLLNNSEYKFQRYNWEETTKGVSLRAKYKYRLDKLGHGSLLLALQSEFSSISDGQCSYYGLSDSASIGYYIGNNLSSRIILAGGHESTHSLAFQLKHYFHEHLLLNVGARFDYKLRVDNQNFTSIAPRLSLIYLQDYYNIKISYSRSFVDAPYYDRAQTSNLMNNFHISNPEHLSSLQLSFGYTPRNKIWKAEANVFYNYLKDGLYRMKLTVDNMDNSTPNNSNLKMLGAEGIFECRYHGFHTNANITWQRVLKGEEGPFTDHRVDNIPTIFGNDILGYDITLGRVHKLGINIITRFTGNQSSPYDMSNVIPNNTDSNPAYTISARCLFDAGISYGYRRISCQLYAYNLLDKRYSQGGTTYFPYYQMGRNVIFKIKVSLF